MSRADTTAAVTSNGTLFAAARRLCDRADARLALPRRLYTRWTEPSRTIGGGAADDTVTAGPVTRFRRQVVPWLDRTRTLGAPASLRSGRVAGCPRSRSPSRGRG